MAKYLDPKADVTFKKVFGEHKNLVISLLNALPPMRLKALTEMFRFPFAEKEMYSPRLWDMKRMERIKCISLQNFTK